MKNVKKNKITLEVLFSEIKHVRTDMAGGFERVEKSFERKTEDLAVMVKNGFDRVDTQLGDADMRFDTLENRLMSQLDRHTDDIRLLKTKVGIR